jgi:hypothetical protein
MEMTMNIQVKPHITVAERRLPFECVALVLQGGGALGAYQAGVYEALAEANIHPDWVSGVPIGAINAAIIAGNAPNDRVGCARFGPTLRPADYGLCSTTHSLSRGPTPCAIFSTR